MSVWLWLSHPWAVAVTAALLHFLWQGTLLALVGVAVLRLLRLPPQLRYAAWLTVFALMAAAPLVTFLMLQADESLVPSNTFPQFSISGSGFFGGVAHDAVTEPSTHIITSSANGASSIISWFDPSDFARWQPLVLMTWFIGVLALSLRLVVGTAWLIAVGRRLEPIPQELERRCERLARRLGLARLPRLMVSPRVIEPFAWRLVRPMVVLPASWLSDVPGDVLEAVIAHELAHLRRHDVWVNLFQRVIETLLFFHPCVWWVSRRIRLERELCCDAEAVRATGQAVLYAKALETVALKRRACAGPQLAVGLGGTRMALLHRVKQVLGVETSAAETGWWSVGLAGIGVTAACWTALTFATPTVDGDESPVVKPSADLVDPIAQRENGPPRPPRRDDDDDHPRPPRRDEGDHQRPRGPRDGERPPGPRDDDGPRRPGPHDGDGPRGPREGDHGPEGRPGRPPEGHHEIHRDGVPPEAIHEMMRAIHELREEVHMLRRELNEIRERGPGRGPDGFGPPGRPGADNRPPMNRGPEDRPGRRPPEGRDGDRGPGPEARGGDRGPRPEGREPPRGGDRRPEGDRGPGPDGRPGDRGPRQEGPRPEGRGPDRRPEGRDGDHPRPEGRPGRPPEGERRPEERRPEGERTQNEERPVSALALD